jgi:hypothetical protein
MAVTLPTPYCDLNSVTIENLTSDPQVLEGSFDFEPNETQTISFAGMTVYHQVYLATAFQSASNAPSPGPVLSILSYT